MARMKEMAMEIAEKEGKEFNEVTDEDVAKELYFRAVTALVSDNVSDVEKKKWSEYLDRVNVVA